MRVFILRQMVVAENGMTLYSSRSFSRIRASSGRESKLDIDFRFTSFPHRQLIVGGYR